MRGSSSFPVLLGLAANLFLAAPVLPQEPAATDPPNGFSAQARGALRLTDMQARRVKPISAAPLSQFYPREARARGQTGTVMLDLLVDASGVVMDVRVLEEEPLGMGFGDAAAASARTYRFQNPFNRLVARTTTVRFLP